jgi:DNA polymerase III epsilon subunit-like protein
MLMRILVFDTETTGLPETKIINPDTLNLWPHIVQFSYVIYDVSLNTLVESNNYIIKVPENVVISEEVVNIHGITNEICDKKGISIEHVLYEFFHYLKNVDMIVGHNIEFDFNMVKIELLRIIYNKVLTNEQLTFYKHHLHFVTNCKNTYCTLKESITLCNITALNKNGRRYLKYPKLIELHQTLFHTSPTNLHNSFNDILVTLRCFMKLKYDTDLLEKCKLFKQLSNSIFPQK